MRILGGVLLAAGIVVIGIGVAGQVGSWGAKTERAGRNVATTSTTSTGASNATGTTGSGAGGSGAGGSAAGGSSTSTSPISSEDVAQFVDALGNALRTGDTNFLVSRLNPAVVSRYGSAQCLGALAAARDASATFTVKQVSDPADYDWTTDGKTISIAETVTVDVDRVQRGVADSASLHVVRVGGRFTWLVDCGNPIGP
jgi:hypothetical protein